MRSFGSGVARWVASFVWVSAVVVVLYFVAGPVLALIGTVLAILGMERLERDLAQKRLAAELAQLEYDAIT